MCAKDRFGVSEEAFCASASRALRRSLRSVTGGEGRRVDGFRVPRWAWACARAIGATEASRFGNGSDVI